MSIAAMTVGRFLDIHEFICSELYEYYFIGLQTTTLVWKRDSLQVSILTL
jgi:hypothetical protein